SIVVEAPSFGGYLGIPGAIEGVGFWPRFAARVIDTIVHFVVALATGLMFGIVLVIYAVVNGQDVAPLTAKVGQAGFASYVFAFLGAIGYHTVCEGLHGSSVGK